MLLIDTGVALTIDVAVITGIEAQKNSGTTDVTASLAIK
jgi:hypothetical protein